MPERAPARPKAPPPADARPDPESSLPPLADPVDAQFDDDPASSNITVIEDGHADNPVDADAEQAAVLFANGQESLVRALLEIAVQNNPGPASERLWRMLFDLLQLHGDRAAFDRLGLEFAAACETSPPAWRGNADSEPAARAGEALIVLSGASDLPRLATALAARQPIRLDLSKLAGGDDAVAGGLCDLLGRARRQTVPLALVGHKVLADRLDAGLKAGRAEAQASWLLLLELLQYSGEQSVFEDKAIDYAVTFEVSPPSWEERPKTAPAPLASPAPPAEAVLPLSGELRNCRFQEVVAFVDSHAQPVLDFSQVVRLDFTSAGTLRNILEPRHKQGREILIRHPNHLVAELMNLVGMSEVARIIIPRS